LYNFCSECIHLAVNETTSQDDINKELDETTSQKELNDINREEFEETKAERSSQYKVKPNFTFLAFLCMKVVRGSTAALAFADDLLRKVKTRVKRNRRFDCGPIRTGPASFQYRMS
jgi:hypothetical protein